MNYYRKPNSHRTKNLLKIQLDLCNYAIKSDV